MTPRGAQLKADRAKRSAKAAEQFFRYCEENYHAKFLQPRDPNADKFKRPPSKLKFSKD